MRNRLRGPGALFAACGVALLSWLSVAAAPAMPDTLVMGHVPKAAAGQRVTVTVGGSACAARWGGATDAAGGFGLVLTNCGPGTATLMVDGVATSVTFTLHPGVPVYLHRLGSPTPSPTKAVPRGTPAVSTAPATPASPTAVPHAAGTPAPPTATPATGNTTGPTPAAPAISGAKPRPSAGGLAVPDTLVMGTIAGARAGQAVTVTTGGAACATVGGGVVAEAMAFALVVGDCGPGAGRLALDGRPIGEEFPLQPGSLVRVIVP